jgi:hypothetical protein
MGKYGLELIYFTTLHQPPQTFSVLRITMCGEKRREKLQKLCPKDSVSAMRVVRIRDNLIRCMPLVTFLAQTSLSQILITTPPPPKTTTLSLKLQFIQFHTPTVSYTSLLWRGPNYLIYILFYFPCVCGSLVTTAWRVLRLRIEETASRYGG